MLTLKWEWIGNNTEGAVVTGGWLVRSVSIEHNETHYSAITYVPDLKYVYYMPTPTPTPAYGDVIPLSANAG